MLETAAQQSTVNTVHLWQRVLNCVRHRMEPQAFQTWIAPLWSPAQSADSLTVVVSDSFTLGWIKDHYMDLLHAALAEAGGVGVKLVLALDQSTRATICEVQTVPAVEAAPLLSGDEPPQLEAADSLGLSAPVGETTLVAIPMVRHFLFAPDRTKHSVRHFNVECKHRGQRLVQAFRIGDAHAAPGKGYGVLTVRHQKALFALQEIWQQQSGQMVHWRGRRLGLVKVTSWQLEDRIFGTHGGRQKQMLRQVLQELTSIPVAIKNYIDADGEVTDVDMTGLLAGAFFSQSAKGSKGQRRSGAWVEIVLGEVLTRAFEMGNHKPLALRVMDDMPDIPALLYPKLDYLLCDKTEVRYRLPTLVQNLGLTGQIERQPSRRRRLFSAAASELDGKPLSKPGRVLYVRVAQGAAADGEDLLIASSSCQPAEAQA